MPIFYPPEYIQQQVNGPNPVPNLGGAFDSLMALANKRQASAQDLLQMLLQSVPETGGQRATVAGEIAKQPGTIGALEPGKAPLFRRRGQPSEHEVVSQGFTKAMGALPKRPNVDVGQFQTALKSRMDRAQEYRQATGKVIPPETLNKMAYNDAQALPNTAESLGMQPDEFADYVTASKPEHLSSVAPYVIGHFLKANPNASEDELLALQGRISQAERSNDPAISELTEMIKQQSLDNMRIMHTLLTNRALEINAGREASPKERAEAEQAAKTNTTLITTLTNALPLMDAALKGDQGASKKLAMELGKAGMTSGDRSLNAYAADAMQGKLTEAHRNDLRTRLELAKATLDSAKRVLSTGRVPPAGGSAAQPAGAPAAPPAMPPELEEFFKLLQQSGIDPNTLLDEPAAAPEE